MDYMQQTIENTPDTMGNIRSQDSTALSRIETKLDIIAQSDSAEVVNLLINELNADITEKFHLLSQKISSGSSSDDFSEMKESLSLILMNYKDMIETLGEIKGVRDESSEDVSSPENIQYLNESIQSAHDKLNMLLVSANENNQTPEQEKPDPVEETLAALDGSVNQNAQVLKKEVQHLKEEVYYISETVRKNTDSQQNEKNQENEEIGEVKSQLAFTNELIIDIKKEFASDISEINSKINKLIITASITKDAIIKMTEWFDSETSLADKKFQNLEVRMESIEAKLEKLIDLELKKQDAC